MNNTELENIVINLAKTRNKMREVELRIKLVTTAANGEYNAIYLNDYREFWYESFSEWRGWLEAINFCKKQNVTPPKPDEIELARLLDKRTELRKKIGNIRRSLCAYGRKLLRENLKNEPEPIK